MIHILKSINLTAVLEKKNCPNEKELRNIYFYFEVFEIR